MKLLFDHVCKVICKSDNVPASVQRRKSRLSRLLCFSPVLRLLSFVLLRL